MWAMKLSSCALLALLISFPIVSEAVSQPVVKADSSQTEAGSDDDIDPDYAEAMATTQAPALAQTAIEPGAAAPSEQNGKERQYAKTQVVDALKGPERQIFLKAREALANEKRLRAAAEKKLVGTESLVNKLTSALSRTTTEEESALRTIKQKDLELAQLQGSAIQLQSQNAENQQLSRQLNTAKAAATAAKQELSKTVAQREALKSSVSQVEHQLSEERHTEERLREREISSASHSRSVLDDVEQTLAEEHHVRVGAEESYSKTASQLHSLQAEHRNTVGELQELKKEMDGTMQIEADLKADDTKLSKELTAKDSEIARLKAELQSSQAASTEKDKAIAADRLAIQDLKKEQAVAIHTLQAHAQQQKQEDDATLANLNKKYSAALDSVKAKSAEEEKHLKTQLLQKEHEETSLSAKMIKAEKKAIVRVRKLKTEVKDLLAHEEKMQADTANEDKQLQDARKQIAESQRRDQSEAEEVKEEHTALLSAQQHSNLQAAKVKQLKLLISSERKWLRAHTRKDEQNKEQVTALTLTNTKLKDQVAELKTQANDKHDALRIENALLKKENAESAKNLKEANHEIEEMIQASASVKSRRHTLALLQQEVDNTQAMLQPATK